MRVSKSSVFGGLSGWGRFSEAEPDFEAEPSWHQAIAVDESVVKCGGTPIYVWVAAVDSYNREATHLSGSFGVSLTRTMENTLRFLRRLRGRRPRG